MSRFSAQDMVCVRSERVVFARLNFTMESGDGLVLIGPNGSGKSSLLRIMAGLLKPFAGTLAWDGEDVRKDFDEHRARLHYVGHHDAVKPVLTVRENVAFWGSMRGEASDLEARIDHALELFAISHLNDVPGRFLSAGQKRRVNLARIIAAPAPIWLLDEPTTALDKATVAVLEQAMKDHRKEGGIVVLSTHQDVDIGETKTLNLAEFEPLPVEHDDDEEMW